MSERGNEKIGFGGGIMSGAKGGGYGMGSMNVKNGNWWV